MSEIIQVNGRTYEGVSADFDVVIPDGYMYPPCNCEAFA